MVKISYEHGISDKPLLGKTIPEIFDETCAKFPDREAVVSVHEGIRKTWAELKNDVDEVAHALLWWGVRKGERVGVWSPNYYNWVVIQFATAQIGAILVNINPSYKKDELEYALTQSEVKLLFLWDKFKSSNYSEMLAEVLENSVFGWSLKCGDLEYAFLMNDNPNTCVCTWNDFLAEVGDNIFPRPELDPDDAINIQYTSGTTGRPKGVVLTHHNIINNAYFTGDYMRFSEKDRLAIPVPMYHCFGMVIAAMVCTIYGATMVFPSDSYDARKTLYAVENERCTALHGVPTMFIAESEVAADYDLSTLRTGVMAGAPCPIELMKKLNNVLHLPEIMIAYGETELSPIVTQTRIDDSFEKRTNTVGRPVPHVEVKIIDTTTGRIVPRGEQGEICARGYVCMKGYYNNEEATKKTIDEAGWLHTGDIGTMDDEGYVKITGRLKDMVIRGGENIYPAEIEEFLYRHPAVAEVQVVGVPDIKYGEELAAVIRLKEGSLATKDEIKEWCNGKITHFKIPRHVVFTKTYPLTVTGKIQKFKLREQLIEQLGLQNAAGVETA